MSYAAVSDLQVYLASFVVTATSAPNTTQVNEIIANASSEIDAALLSRGLAVPVAVPAEFVTYLVQLNAMGAAGMVLYQAFPSTMGPGQSPFGKYLTDTYQARLADFRKGIGIPVGLSRQETQQSPSGFFADTGSWGQDMTQVDAYGDLIKSKPAFSRGMPL